MYVFLEGICGFRWPYPIYMCRVRAAVTSCSMGAAIAIMFLICVVRYSTITSGLHPSQLLDSRHSVWCLLGAVWSLCLLFSLPTLCLPDLCGFIYWKDDCNLVYYEEDRLPYYVTVTLLFVIVPGVAMPVLYGRIFYISLKSRKRVQPHVSNPSNIIMDRVQLKLTIMLCMTYVCFIAVYLPYIVLLFIHIWGDSEVIRYEFAITAYLLNLQAVINPFLYGIINQEFRRGYIKLLDCRQKSTTQG